MCLLLGALSGCGRTEDMPPAQSSAGPISIRAARIPESPGGERLAVYAEIENQGPDDALVAVRSDVSATGSLHVMEMAGGMMTMRATTSLPLPAGEVVSLRTGSAHGMLEGLARVPLPGESVSVTFVFASGTELVVSVPVVSLADIVGGP